MKMQLLTWNNAKPTPGPDTRPASSMVVGAGCRGENPRLRRREKNVLDFPFYRSAFRSRITLVAENLFLRKQLAFYREHKIKPQPLTDAARLSLVFWSRLFDW